MDEDEKDGRLDALLDSLLSDYSAVEPRPGLDLRIRAGLRARAEQRPRQWMLIAAAAAVVALVAAVTAVHPSKQRVPGNVVAVTTSSDPKPSVQTTAPQLSAKAAPRFLNRRASVRSNARNELLLQVANAMPATDNLVFEHEKLYLSPEPQPAPEPAAEPQTSAPSINIKDLGVQTIEIKDLPSVKGMDSKGNL